MFSPSYTGPRVPISASTSNISGAEFSNRRETPRNSPSRTSGKLVYERWDTPSSSLSAHPRSPSRGTPTLSPPRSPRRSPTRTPDIEIYERRRSTPRGSTLELSVRRAHTPRVRDYSKPWLNNVSKEWNEISKMFKESISIPVDVEEGYYEVYRIFPDTEIRVRFSESPTDYRNMIISKGDWDYVTETVKDLLGGGELRAKVGEDDQVAPRSQFVVEMLDRLSKMTLGVPLNRTYRIVDDVRYVTYSIPTVL